MIKLTFLKNRYQNFCQIRYRLSKNDYFGGEIEHSKKWTELEHKAKTFFMDSYESDSNESHRKACSKGKFNT